MQKFDLKWKDMFELEQFFGVIDRYSLKISDLFWDIDGDKDKNLKYISGKINDNISFFFDVCGFISLEGDIPSNAINHFSNSYIYLKLNVHRNNDERLIEVLRWFCPKKEFILK